MGTPSDPHAELGVSPDATQAEITRAFRRLLRRHHPDTRDSDANPSSAESDARLQRIIEAYAGLVPAPTSGESRAQQPRRPSQVSPGSYRRDRLGGELVRAGPIRWSAT